MKSSCLPNIDPVDRVHHLATTTITTNTHQPKHHHRHQQHHRRHSTSTRSLSPSLSSSSSSNSSSRRRMRSPPSTLHSSSRRSSSTSPYIGPRSPSDREHYHQQNNSNTLQQSRLPTLFDRIKQALESPRQRVTIIDTSVSAISPQVQLDKWTSPQQFTPTSSSASFLPPITETRYHDRGHHANAPSFFFYDEPEQPLLYGVPVSKACKRAYSGQNLGIDRSLKRLQLEDGSTVEHRTIAFSTHLMISRWESSPPAPVPAQLASTTPDSADSKTTATTGSVTQTAPLAAEETASPSCTSSSLAVDHGVHASVLDHQTGKTPQNQSQGEQGNNNNNSTDEQTANRLLLLANYIRHILSLTAGSSQLHHQATAIQQRLAVLNAQRQQLQQGPHANKNHPNEPAPSYNYNTPMHNTPNSPSISIPTRNSRSFQDSRHSLPSPLSAGPGSGPSRIESSFSVRRHRQYSEYHDHQTRRHMHHSQQQQGGAGNNDGPDPWSSVSLRGHALPSPTSPTFRYDSSNNTTGSESSLNSKRPSFSASITTTTPKFSPLIKVPYQNLTLTLALIYVDRLKSKYPEARGEPGCSHRLFLVAYIIAAKYRCSVEIESLLREQQQLDPYSLQYFGPDGEHLIHVEQEDENEDQGPDCVPLDRGANYVALKRGSENRGDTLQQRRRLLQERIADAKSRAEVIFSNYEWVRLLSLGSFFRPPPRPIPLSKAKATTVVSPRPLSPPVTPTTAPNAIRTQSSSAKAIPSKSASPPSIIMAKREEISSAQSLPIQGNFTTLSNSTTHPSASASMVLQVQDLDRMENEFLTFLDFDLSIGPQDLDTCWNLLVQNKV